ncbi:MAG: c-type cytochrome biogenesis protein CcmI, partial [Gammaproteobacteria bacterium]
MTVILPSLLAKDPPKDLDRKKINRAIFEKKLKELENDYDRDLIDKEQYSIAKLDLERSLIDDLEDQKDVVFKRSDKVLPIIILLVLPAIAVFAYLKLNNGLVSLNPEFEKQLAEQQSAQMPDIEVAIAQLEAKLKQNSSDLDGWKMLGRSYLVSKQFEKAVNVYKKANELSKGADPEILIAYGEAKGFAAGNSFDKSSMLLFSKALKIDPNNERGLWYAGIAAYQLENYKSSVEYLEKLLQLVPSNQIEVRNALAKYLNDAKQKAGIEITDDSVITDNSATVRQIDGAKSSITVNVSLSNELHKSFVDSDTLFIYARAMNGPKMPLALVKMTAGDLPTTVTLDDSVSMIPSMTLSSMEQVEVFARISKSGQAVMQSGDIFGSVKSVKT